MRVLIAIGLIAIILLSACVWARYLVVWAAINKGLGTPRGGLFSLICAGVAHASPIYAAFLVAFAPFSLNRRIVLGAIWLGAVMSAFAIGNIDRANLGNVMIFSPGLIYSLPVIALGWLVPFSYLHWFRGWRLEFLGSERQTKRERITISTLLLLTFLVSLCFFSLQFSSQRFITIALVGLLATSILGSILAIAVWFVMRTRFAILFLTVGGIGCYHLLSYIFFQSGAPAAFAFGNALIVTSVLAATLSGLFVFRLNGGVLLTGNLEGA